jgi:hypothetical protein
LCANYGQLLLLINLIKKNLILWNKWFVICKKKIVRVMFVRSPKKESSFNLAPVKNMAIIGNCCSGLLKISWIFPSKYTVYTLIWYANKHRFFPLNLKKWFGVLQEYPIINNILLYDIRIGGVDCTNTAVPLLSYLCMFQGKICSQQLEICKSVCLFIVLAIIVETD